MESWEKSCHGVYTQPCATAAPTRSQSKSRRQKTQAVVFLAENRARAARSCVAHRCRRGQCSSNQTDTEMGSDKQDPASHGSGLKPSRQLSSDRPIFKRAPCSVNKRDSPRRLLLKCVISMERRKRSCSWRNIHGEWV